MYISLPLYNDNFIFCFSALINFNTASKSSSKKFDISPLGCTRKNDVLIGASFFLDDILSIEECNEGCHPFFCPRITPVVHHRLHGLVFVVACRQPRKRGGGVMRRCYKRVSRSLARPGSKRIPTGLASLSDPTRCVGYKRVIPTGLVFILIQRIVLATNVSPARWRVRDRNESQWDWLRSLIQRVALVTNEPPARHRYLSGRPGSKTNPDGVQVGSLR
ncbi:hypothetical protein BA6E_11343 [Bacteroidales bacterium 6E]|nr:hypothetical protein BA6E_11343 [Bacteroidales bacterium 6E]